MRMKKVFSLTLALVILLTAMTGCNNKKSGDIENSQTVSEGSSDTNAVNNVTTEEQTKDKSAEETANDSKETADKEENKSNTNINTDNKQTAQSGNDADTNGAGTSNNVTAAPSTRPTQAQTTTKPQTTVTQKPQTTVTPSVQKPQTTVTPSTGNTQSSTESEMISQVLSLVNKERAARGLSKVTYRSDLQKAADIRAGEIINTFSHTRPNGTDCFTVFKEIGITNYKTVGENIANGYATADAVMNGWMNSEGHRANILNSDFEGIVIGVKKISNNQYAWVQLFITQ